MHRAPLLPKGLHPSGYLAATRQTKARTARSGKYLSLGVIARVNTRSQTDLTLATGNAS
jgi:hypothetical protein